MVAADTARGPQLANPGFNRGLQASLGCALDVSERA